ncbi:restriction endonuclease [Streptomyces sp. NPDC048441]|uniref:restriction endonuclease n=1 Tax=Streptomyces sp. NPDC048441 TaxID=3365552 RepID=UPI003714498A
MSNHHVPYDLHGRITSELPLDRHTHEQLVRAALSWSDSDPTRPIDDYVQVGILLAGAARAVADEVRQHAALLPTEDGRRLFAEIVLQEADGRLSTACRNLHGV